MQYRLSCYIKSLFLLLLLLQNDNFINIGLQTPCQVLEIQSLFMTTSEKRVTGGCSLSAGQRKSVWKPLGWTHDVYFFYILLHVYVTHAGCSEQFLLLLLLLLWDKGFGALQSLPRLCSWTGKILTGIQNCHLNPGGASKRPRELRRWWNVFQQLDSQTESTAVEERFWMRVNVFQFLYDFVCADPIDLHSDPASWLHDLWPFVLVRVVECRRLWTPDSRILSLW